MLWASRKTATAKATRNRNCPTWNQGDFSLSRSDGFKLVVIGANSLLGKFVVSHPAARVSSSTTWFTECLQTSFTQAREKGMYPQYVLQPRRGGTNPNQLSLRQPANSLFPRSGS